MFKLEYIKRNCCLCHDCIDLCSTGAIIVTDEGMMTWDKDKCSRCESCCDVCVNEALYGVWENG